MYATPRNNAIGQVHPVLPHTAYQVDYAAINCGRIVPASKRNIRFKFGYTDVRALSSGKNGQDCRGSEHEVRVTWSLSSGKQAITFDQHDVFFGVGDSTQTKFTHCWKDERGHTLEVKIHAVSMSTKSNPDPRWKQYDIIVDGVSFFDMPKIFEIGVFPKENASRKLALKFTQAPNSPKENAPRKLALKLTQAPNSAWHPSRASRNAQAGRFRNVSKNNTEPILPPDDPKEPEPKYLEAADLLSFDDLDDPAPAFAAPPTQIAPALTNDAPTPALAQTNYSFIQTPTQSNHCSPSQAPAQTSYTFSQAPDQTTYAPAQHIYAPPSNPFLESKIQDREDANYISPTRSPGHLRNNYTTSAQDSSAFNLNGALNKPHNEASNTAPAYSTYAPQPNHVTPPVSSLVLVPATPAPNSYGVDGAMTNLVNMDDIFGVSAVAPTTKESVDTQMQNVNAHKSLGQLKGSNTHDAKNHVMNPFNSAPVYDQQSTYNEYATHQQQHNNYGYQQPYVQPGFGY